MTHKLTRTHTACQRPGWASHATAWPRAWLQRGVPHTVTKLHVLPLAPTQRPLRKGKDEKKGRELRKTSISPKKAVVIPKYVNYL